MNNVIKIGAFNFGPFEEIELEFNSFNCWVVQSENKTNSGQESNGGGKSCLLDIVPICLIGTSIQGRDLKNYINWNGKESYFEVHVCIQNALSDIVVNIKRKFYNNSRSSELVILVNGEVPKSIPSKKGVEFGVDIEAGTQYILNEILGISKEDLLTYYLISREKYSPFMRIGNSKKIQTISRFSQADQVDRVIDQIKKEIEVKRVEFRKLEDLQIAHNTKKAFLENEIETSSKKAFDKNREDGIKDLQSQIDSKNVSLESCKSEISRLEKELLEKEKDYNEKLLPLDFKKDMKSLQKSIDKRLDDMNWVERQLSKDIEDENYKSLKENESTFIEKKEGLLDSKREAESIIIEHEKILKGSIECPKCTHKFVISEEISLEEASSIVEECNDILLSLDHDIEVVDQYIQEKNKAIVDYESAFDEKKCEYREVLDLLHKENTEDKESIDALKNQVKQREWEREELDRSIQFLRKGIDNHHTLIVNSQSSIDTLLSYILTLRDQAYINETPEKKKELKHIEKELKSTEKEKNFISKDISLREQWMLNFEDFKFFLANKPIQFICHKVNGLLNRIGSDLFIKIDGFRLLKSGKVKQELNPIVFRNMSNPQPYKQYSGGERVRIDIATDTSFQEIINSNSKTGGLNYYQNDEVLSELDSLGIENVAKSFDTLDKTMLLVTHSGANLAHKNTIKIIKENDISSIQ